MFLGCSPTGMEVIPGKSTMVRLGQELEKIFKIMGISLIIFFDPQTLSVTSSIVFLTSAKLVNLFFFPPYKTSSNSA
jgi:hypothetical protein